MASFFSKLKEGLKKTRDTWFDSIFGEDRISDEFYDELEESLILADMGVEASTGLVEQLKDRRSKSSRTEAKLKMPLCSLLQSKSPPRNLLCWIPKAVLY